MKLTPLTIDFALEQSSEGENYMNVPLDISEERTQEIVDEIKRLTNSDASEETKSESCREGKFSSLKIIERMYNFCTNTNEFTLAVYFLGGYLQVIQARNEHPLIKMLVEAMSQG